LVYNLYVYFHKIGGEILKHVLLRGDNSIFSLFLARVFRKNTIKIKEKRKNTVNT
jgi:hypothetical protein